MEVRLDGFGRLVDRDFTFGDGFNLIFGLNETGKSTLQRAIMALLYGFFNQGRIKSTDREIVDAFRPWAEEAPYAASLKYALDDGTIYQVSRTFDGTPETTLITLPEGNDVSGNYKMQSQGRLFFAEAQMGMAREVFENTSYIRQAELVALENATGAITDTLMKLSATGSTDTTATDALDLLKNVHATNVGSSRAWTKPLAKTVKRLDKLENERSEALETRRALFAAMVELNQSKTELNQLEETQEELIYLETLVEYQTFEGRLATIEKVSNEVSECAQEMNKWSAWADFPEHLRDDIIRLSTQYTSLKQTLLDGQLQAKQAEQDRASLAKKIKVAEQRMTELGKVDHVRSDMLTEVRRLSNQWELSQKEAQSCRDRWQIAQAALIEAEQQLSQEGAKIKPVIALGYDGLAQFKQEWLTAEKQVKKAKLELTDAETEWAKTGITEEQFEEVARQAQELQASNEPPAQTRRGCKWFSLGRPAQQTVQKPTEVKIYEDLAPIHSRLVQARVTLADAQHSLADAEARTSAALGNLGGIEINPLLFGELNQILETYKQTDADVKHQRQSVAALQAEFEKAHEREIAAQTILRTNLNELEIEEPDLRAAVAIYEEQCDRKADLEREAAILEGLKQQLNNYDHLIEQQAEKQRTLEETRDKLRQVLAEANINWSGDTEVLQQALDEFEARVKNRRQWAVAEQAHKAAIDRLQTLDGSERLKESLKEAERKLAELRAVRPELAQLQADKTAESYRTRLDQTEKEISAVRQTLNSQQHDIDQLKKEVRPLAEIDEEISYVKMQLQKLEWYGNIVEQAQAELAKTTAEFQKQFAPKLEVLMSDSIKRITQGRYIDIRIDPKNLSVSTKAPETGQVVSVEQLSTGTRELLYLMLRVSIARLMSSTGEQLPLLLDDPLVQSDRGRQEQTLNFLSQLAEEMQVFLFTKDGWVRDWVTKNLRNSQLTEYTL